MVSVSFFLTSKVRLHCDYLDPPYLPATRRLFPDLKGQAPLRLGLALRAVMQFGDFFLTSKVRLHCDPEGMGLLLIEGPAFS